jgi:hypothetical protein
VTSSAFRGVVTATRPETWEDSLICGNGRMGVLVRGDPEREIITFSHERLFMAL